MGMLKAGSAGVTAQEIQKALQFPADDAILHAGYKSLLDSLKVSTQI